MDEMCIRDRQFPFCYLATDKDLDLVKRCREAGMGFIAMKALSGGQMCIRDRCNTSSFAEFPLDKSKSHSSRHHWYSLWERAVLAASKTVCMPPINAIIFCECSSGDKMCIRDSPYGEAGIVILRYD